MNTLTWQPTDAHPTSCGIEIQSVDNEVFLVPINTNGAGCRIVIPKHKLRQFANLVLEACK